MTDMHTRLPQQRITRLAFKYEGENEEGMPIGPLMDQDSNPVFSDARWVTKKDALRIAGDLSVELFEF